MKTSVRFAGNALLVTMFWITLFGAILGVIYNLSSATARRTSRDNNFWATKAVAEGVADIIYGRFSRWVDANNGVTPSIADASTTGVPGNASFPAILANVNLSNFPALAGYQVISQTLKPIRPDDTPDSGNELPNASTFSRNPTSNYQRNLNKFLSPLTDLYDPTNFSPGINYLLTVTVAPTTIDAGSAGPVTIKRYMQKGDVSPFTYNVFSNGVVRFPEFGQGVEIDGSIYASVGVEFYHQGTIIVDKVHYGDYVQGPSGNKGDISGLQFQKSDGTPLDPYQSGLLRQVSKIEIVPELQNLIASHTANGTTTRTNADEFVNSTGDNYSRREVIEPPRNLSNDTAPDAIKQRRLYNQADVRMKITTIPNAAGAPQARTAKATFVNLDGSIAAEFKRVGAAWVPTTSGSPAWTVAMVAAVNVKMVDDSTPFQDALRRSDNGSLNTSSTPQPGQPSATNQNHAIETVDVNVGVLKDVINANQVGGGSGVFNNNMVYIWDDGASGEKNGVRLYNAGVLPDNGLVVGSTNPVYIKGDLNTGTTLASPTALDSAIINQPQANKDGYNRAAGGDVFATVDERSVVGYVPKPAGVFGDSVTVLSQNWTDANSLASTRAAKSTTYNAVLGFGSGDLNKLQLDDCFDSTPYASVLVLETWNNTRWNQLGEQMALYHSIYNLQKNPNWYGPGGGWFIQQSEYDARTTRVPVKWGYIAFNRGRYNRL